MPDRSGPAGGGDPVPLFEAPLLGASASRERERLARRNPRRLTALGALLALVLAAAVVLPMKLSGARAVSSGLAGVFNQPTVRFSVSLEGGKTSGYSLDLTLASRSGADLSSARSYLADLVVRRGSKTLAELRETSKGVYVRLGGAFAREALTLSRRSPGPDRSRAVPPRLGPLLGALAEGRWIGVRRTTLAPLLRRAERRLAPELRGAVRREAAHVESSLAQSWDELVSLHEVGASGGTTEYSVALPLRRFLLTALGKLAAAPEPVPGIEVGLRLLTEKISALPASLSLPIDLWLSDGSLVRFSLRYDGRALDAVVDHPLAPRTPTEVSYLSRRQLRVAVRAAFGAVGRLRSAPHFLRASISPRPWAGAWLLLASYSHSHSFAALLDRSSPYSLWALARKLPDGRAASFVVDAPSERPGQVSVHVGPAGRYVVLAAATRRPGRCAGILLTSPRATGPVLGARRQPLTPSPFIEPTPPGGCDAAAIASVPVARGWYGYAPLSGTISSMSRAAAGKG